MDGNIRKTFRKYFNDEVLMKIIKKANLCILKIYMYIYKKKFRHTSTCESNSYAGLV